MRHDVCFDAARGFLPMRQLFVVLYRGLMILVLVSRENSTIVNIVMKSTPRDVCVLFVSVFGLPITYALREGSNIQLYGIGSCPTRHMDWEHVASLMCSTVTFSQLSMSDLEK